MIALLYHFVRSNNIGAAARAIFNNAKHVFINGYTFARIGMFALPLSNAEELKATLDLSPSKLEVAASRLGEYLAVLLSQKHAGYTLAQIVHANIRHVQHASGLVRARAFLMAQRRLEQVQVLAAMFGDLLREGSTGAVELERYRHGGWMDFAVTHVVYARDYTVCAASQLLHEELSMHSACWLQKVAAQIAGPAWGGEWSQAGQTFLNRLASALARRLVDGERGARDPLAPSVLLLLLSDANVVAEPTELKLNWLLWNQPQVHDGHGVLLPTPEFLSALQPWLWTWRNRPSKSCSSEGARLVRIVEVVMQVSLGNPERSGFAPVRDEFTHAMLDGGMVRRCLWADAAAASALAVALQQKMCAGGPGLPMMAALVEIFDREGAHASALQRAAAALSPFSIAELYLLADARHGVLRRYVGSLHRHTVSRLSSHDRATAAYASIASEFALFALSMGIEMMRRSAGTDRLHRSNPLGALLLSIPRFRKWSGRGQLQLSLADLADAHPSTRRALDALSKQKVIGAETLVRATKRGKLQFTIDGVALSRLLSSSDQMGALTPCCSIYEDDKTRAACV